MRRLNPFFYLAVLLLAAIVAWCALPAADAFTDSEGTTLPNHNANWVANTGTMAIYSNAADALRDFAYVRAFAHWEGDVFDNDQYAQATMTSCYSYDNTTGVAVRMDATAETGYYAWCRTNNTCRIFKTVKGSQIQVGTTYTGTVPNGTLMRLEVEGTTLRLLIGGSTVISTTDSAIASGYAGVHGRCYEAGSPSSIDDWQAGNLSAAARSRIIVIAFGDPLWSD